MTNTLRYRNRLIAAARIARHNADTLYAAAEDPNLTSEMRKLLVAQAIAWQQHYRITLGDIGEKTREVEAPAPLDVPITQPAEPVPA